MGMRWTTRAQIQSGSRHAALTAAGVLLGLLIHGLPAAADADPAETRSPGAADDEVASPNASPPLPAEAENDEGNEDEGRDEDDDEDEGASRVPAPDSGTAEAPALPSSATDAAVLEAMQAAIRVKLWSRAIWLIEQRMQQGGAARLWWELGHALAGRKQTVAAMHAFRRYLEAEPGSWDRAHVETRLAELGRTPAKVALRSTPAGASVHIDDVAQPDKTPTTLHLPPGIHRLQLSHPQHGEVAHTLRLQPGTSQTLHLRLKGAARPRGDGRPVLPPLPPAPQTSSTAPSDPSAAVWTAAGVASAAVVSGTILGFFALAKQNDFEARPRADTADQGERLALFADVSFALALAAAVTGLVLHLSERAAARKKAASRARTKRRGLAGRARGPRQAGKAAGALGTAGARRW